MPNGDIWLVYLEASMDDSSAKDSIIQKIDRRTGEFTASSFVHKPTSPNNSHGSRAHGMT